MGIRVICRGLHPKMNFTFFPTLALLLFIKSGFSQQNIPIVKANYDYVTVRWDKQLLQYPRQITPKEKLDIYDDICKKTHLYTDIDSISLLTDPGVSKYDFAFLLHGKDTQHTLKSGAMRRQNRFVPRLLWTSDLPLKARFSVP